MSGNATLERPKAERAQTERPNIVQVDELNDSLRHGFIQHQMGRLDEAETLYRQYLNDNPGDVEALRLLGSVIAADGTRDDEAGQIFHAVVQVDPKHVPGLTSFASYLWDSGARTKAKEMVTRALELQPEFWPAKYLADTMAQKLATVYGYDHYMARMHNKIIGRRDIAKPYWDGSYLGPDKRLLIFWEDGAGDNVMVARFLKDIKRQSGAYLIVEWNRNLYPLLEDLEGPDEVHCGDSEGHCDFVSPIMTSWMLLGPTWKDLPGSVNYIKKDAERIQGMKDRYSDIFAPGRKVIGVCWAGNPNSPAEPYRCIDKTKMIDAVHCGLEQSGIDATILSLTYRQTPIALNMYDDTAAAAAACDLVITSDTSLAHIAGAMGVPTWVVIPNPFIDWRWQLLDGNCMSMWYPSAKVYLPEGYEKKIMGSPLSRVERDLITYDFPE